MSPVPPTEPAVLNPAVGSQPALRAPQAPAHDGREPSEASAAAVAPLPRRLVSGLLATWTSQVASGVAAVVVTPLLLHHLGRSAFGVWALASGVVTYFELFELGFGGSAVKLLAEDASTRRARAVRTLNTVVAALVPLGVLALGVGLVIAFAAPSLFTIPTALHGQAVTVFALLALGLAVSIPGDTFGGALEGFQRFDLSSGVNTMLAVVTAAVTIAVVLGHGGIVALAAATTAVSISFHGVRWRVLRRVFPEARLRPRFVERKRLREVTQLSGWFLLVDLANTVTSTADLVVVGVLFGVRTAAVYAVGFKLAQMARNVRGAFTWMLLPHASAASTSEQKATLRPIVMDGTRIGLVVSLIPALVLTALASPGIRAWVGPGYGQSAQVLVVLLAAFTVTSVVNPISMVLLGAGYVRVTSLLAVANATCNLVLSILLAHVLGPVGVAIGTLGGALLVSLPGLLILGNRALGIRVARLAKESLLPNVLPAGASALVLFGLGALVGGSVMGLVVAAILGTITYGVVFLAVGTAPSERRRVLAVLGRLRP